MYINLIFEAAYPACAYGPYETRDQAEAAQEADLDEHRVDGEPYKDDVDLTAEAKCLWEGN